MGDSGNTNEKLHVSLKTILSFHYAFSQLSTAIKSRMLKKGTNQLKKCPDRDAIDSYVQTTGGYVNHKQDLHTQQTVTHSIMASHASPVAEHLF